MRRRYFTMILAMMLLPVIAGAQALKGSYFLDNSLMRNRLNPAFSPRAGYLSLPVLSNFGMGVHANIGPADFLYPKNGELYTYLNQNVSVQEFSNNLPGRPVVDFDLDTDILNFGFFASKNSFWSFDLGFRVDGQLGMPRDLFMFAKQGMSAPDQVYSLDGFDLYQTSSIYASIGNSRDLSGLVEGLRVGGKVRVFLPVEHIGMSLGESTLALGEDAWKVNTDAYGVVAASFMTLNPDALNGNSDAEFLSVNTENIGPAGFGISFDLGAEYKLSVGSVADGLTFSLSALDLGSYVFNTQYLQGFESKGEATYEGMKDLEIGGDSDMSSAMDAIMDEFMALANLEESDQPRYSSIGTRAKIFAGVEYPFLKDKMSLGLLYSGKFGYSKPINDLTVSYNLNPSKWFNLGFSWSFLNAWKTFGWMLELTPKAGINLFVGSDYTFTEVMPDTFFPVDKLWMNARFGLSLMLGNKFEKR